MAIAESMSYKIPVITTTGTPWQEIKENDAGWWLELNQENITSSEEIIESVVNKLLSAGRSPKTPAAVIQQATVIGQRCLKTSLDSIRTPL